MIAKPAPRPSDRYASVWYAVAIWRLISVRPYTRAELANGLGLGERTVRRLLDTLIDAHAPIVTSRRGTGKGPLEFRASGVL